MSCTLVGPCTRYTHFFANHPQTTQIYTLSLHDALPIFGEALAPPVVQRGHARQEARLLLLGAEGDDHRPADRKSTRLNSSHRCISYAVFCLKKKNALGRISAIQQ